MTGNQPTLLQLARAGFERAKVLLKRQLCVQIGLLACGLVALGFEGNIAYIFSLFAFILQCVGWLVGHRAFSIHATSESACRQALLIDGLGSDQDSLSNAELRLAFTPEVSSQALTTDANSYYTSTESSGPSRLRAHILESAFWSKYLYNKAAFNGFIFVGLLFIGLVIGLLVAIPAASSDSQLLVARVVVVLLGSAVLFEHLGTALAWHTAAFETDRVLQRGQRADLSNQYTMLSLVGDYSAAVASVPPIPSGLYERERDHLNGIWDEYYRQEVLKLGE